MLERLGRERLIFGHRGVPEEAPENTVAGFQRAVELGLDGVELDVRLCKSGVPVVLHDDKTDKLTDGSGFVSELTFEELKQLDAGIHFGEKYRGEKIPSLEEVLEVLRGQMVVNIELKSRSIPDDRLEAKVIELIEKMGLQSSVILSSFNPFSIRRVARSGANLKTGLLFADDQPIHLRRAWALRFIRVDGIHPRYPLVTDKLLRRARANKWFVTTWTVDDPATATRLFQGGTDIVITNRPRQMREILKQN